MPKHLPIHSVRQQSHLSCPPRSSPSLEHSAGRVWPSPPRCAACLATSGKGWTPDARFFLFVCFFFCSFRDCRILQNIGGGMWGGKRRGWERGKIGHATDSCKGFTHPFPPPPPPPPTHRDDCKGISHPSTPPPTHTQL